jgi:anthranilate synthase component II
MKILVLDNYDSFTYNLVHYLEELTGENVTVARNDEITIEQAAAYDRIVLSPGPGIPDEAGIMKEMILKLAPEKSILGICLGMQAIAEVFGGHLINLEKVYHGVATDILITDSSETLFSGLPQIFKGGRYHSWVVNKDTLPSCLRITATDANGMIMGFSHTRYDVRGLQFHPESVLTECGKQILANWLGTTLTKTANVPFLPSQDNDHFASPEVFKGTFC